jgi:hypothetical protein
MGQCPTITVNEGRTQSMFGRPTNSVSHAQHSGGVNEGEVFFQCSSAWPLECLTVRTPMTNGHCDVSMSRCPTTFESRARPL